MQEIIINQKEELVMKLLHYFITERGYNPVIIKGVQDEIWLENLNDDYKIVRIVSGHIHNNEQFKFDIFKTKNLLKTIKKKTLSLKINALSIFVDLGDNVNLQEFENIPNIKFAGVKETDDLNKYRFVIDAYPDITKETNFEEEGFELFIKITNDINQKNEGDARMTEDVFTPKRPVITYALVIINVLLYFLSILNPELITNFAVSRYYITNGQYYRLITGIFFHGNIFHLIFNMYALYIIGMQLEGFLGKAKYLSVYLLSGLAGSLMSIFFSTNFSIGASGAIFGLMGSLLYFGYHYRVYLDTTLKSQIIPLIIINLIIGFASSGIDNWAHIGGLVGGILSTMALGIKYKSTKFDMINGIILYLIYILFFIYMIFIKGI